MSQNFVRSFQMNPDFKQILHPEGLSQQSEYIEI